MRKLHTHPVRVAVVACILCMCGTRVRAQLMDEWLVRANATPDAFITGATAVFRNPAVLSSNGRGEGLLVDLRGPNVTGISGMAFAGAYRLDARTTIGAGFQHIGIDGVEQTTNSPDDGTALTLGQDLFAVGASHALTHAVVGANAQYLRASSAFNQPAAVRLGAGASYTLPISVPITVAGDAQSQDNDTYWSAGARVAPQVRIPDWNLYATYGVAGSNTRSGLIHRLTAEGTWRDMLSLQVGAVATRTPSDHETTAIGSIGVKVNRYELGLVREQLASGFGAVNTFRIGMLF